MDKYLRRPTAGAPSGQGLFEKYNLSENPFPSSPYVNPESSDARSNGDIYEPSIREAEYELITRNFIQVPQSDPNHLRLGYIVDTSYVGRGNGKSAFLVNLQRKINHDFCLSISNGVNKCFAITLFPEPGGKTKTFEAFVELIANGIFRSELIVDALVTLRLDAILSLYPDFSIKKHFQNEGEIRDLLSYEKWYSDNNLDIAAINEAVLENSFLQSLPSEFPLYATRSLLFPQMAMQASFIEYYRDLRRGKPRLEFVFSQLVSLFLAAGFNGAYVFVDDFERIPDFQSERQKRDFALELRTCLFDGLYTNARVGFYNMFLILHAGVPRLIQTAWDQSGLEHRSPIFYKVTPKHVILFQKITLENTYSLIRKYLQAYRIKPVKKDVIAPFTDDAIERMADLGEFNASRILGMAYHLLDRAAISDVAEINAGFVQLGDETAIEEPKRSTGIHDAPTKDLRTEE